MEWNKKREVMRNYDRSATTYDAQYAKEQNEKIKSALNYVNIDGSLMLDLGCGTGLLFDHIGTQGKILVGLDISTNVLREAKKRIRRFSNIAVIRADTDFTPFPNKTFDIVYAITLLQNVPNYISTLNEMKRVAKNRSIIIVTGLKKMFSHDAFIKLIEVAGLKIWFIVKNDLLNDIVAICRKS